MRQAVVLCTAFALGLGAADAALAQTAAEDYPQRTVTFLCPFPAGGGTDILTRLLAHELQDKLKRPVVVDNRPGGGTIVAAQAAARAAPDGYTILLAPVTTLAMGPSIHKSLPYDTVRTSRRSASSGRRNSHSSPIPSSAPPRCLSSSR
jgi:tripartite-type tricarboxylate transporter receptor subunit TctC